MQAESVIKPKRKKWMVIGMIILIVAIVAVNIVVVQNKNKGNAKDLEFVGVTEKEFKQTKLIAGIVVAGKNQSFSVDPTKGKVKEVFVEEGQKIEAKQKLFSYENVELSFQSKQMEIDKKISNIGYDQGKKRINSLKKEIQRLKTEANAATDPIQGEQIVQTMKDLETQLQDAESQLKTSELEMEKSNLQAQELKRKQDDLIVYSDLAGIVQNVGESNAEMTEEQGKPLIQVISEDPFQIQGQLTELQMAQIQTNQAITISSKAIPNKTWKGIITNVSSYPISTESGTSQMAGIGESAQNISYYPFTASLESQDGLSPGFHVALEVNLPTKKKLAVPSYSIIEETDTSYVYLLKGTVIHKQKVTTGMGDGEWTGVIDGVTSGDKIVALPTSSLREGMEVKVND